ncbi:MAG TPA: HD domain-containing protein [Levilinea sp.]|nr:HD domain-containing protein [Levilinea sp.]
MENGKLTLKEIIQITHQKGEGWAVAHARRLLELIREIGVELLYDSQVLELAAYTHDWGAFPAYFQKGNDHALRSRQVVETEILPHLNLTATQQEKLLEAIELHDYHDLRPPRSLEALMLREADMLEFLGTIGLAREFARGPKDVGACHRRILERRTGIQGRFSLSRAREMAQVRLERMDQCLRWLEAESFGIL